MSLPPPMTHDARSSSEPGTGTHQAAGRRANHSATPQPLSYVTPRQLISVSYWRILHVNGEDLGPGPRLRLLLENVQNILRPKAHRAQSQLTKTEEMRLLKNHRSCLRRTNSFRRNELLKIKIKCFFKYCLQL
jgi:hypothetical protein